MLLLQDSMNMSLVMSVVWLEVITNIPNCVNQGFMWHSI
jgi:hypothetical protein